MQTHHDLCSALAPHLDALSTASATLLTPLTAVLTTLIAEIDDLRAAHDQLQARVSRIAAQPPVPLPHSIPSLPSSPPPQSPIIDPEMTQPPSPPPPQRTNEKHPVESASKHFQYNTPQKYTEANPPTHLVSLPADSEVNPERLKRRRRSSKRPLSATGTPRVKQEKCEPLNEALSSQENRAIENAKPGSSNSSTLHAPSPSHGFADADGDCNTPKKTWEPKRKPLEERNQNLMVLPTTPTTEMKPKKRKAKVLSYEPIIEGFRNAAVAARAAEEIAARREADNCPPTFRLQQNPKPETTCLQCQDSLRALAAHAPDPEEAFQRLLRSGCRHKEQVPRASTPDGYWAVDFPETPTQPP